MGKQWPSIGIYWSLPVSMATFEQEEWPDDHLWTPPPPAGQYEDLDFDICVNNKWLLTSSFVMLFVQLQADDQEVVCSHLSTKSWSSWRRRGRRGGAGCWALIQLCLQLIGHQTDPGPICPAHKQLIPITVQVTWLEDEPEEIKAFIWQKLNLNRVRVCFDL